MHDVFRALGDPTRRHILDLLRERARTTGELAEEFEQSRYGVMKHLSVLEEAGLVTVRRAGRKRFNHLNAVPLRQVYERWLGQYQEFWSNSLLRLRDVVAAADKPTQEQTMSTFNSFEINQQIELDATPDAVWTALTTDIQKWWAYRVGEANATVSLDARLDGRFEERWGDGEGVVWGRVVDVRRGKRLRLMGSLGMTGAGTNDYMYELEAKGGKTVLKLSHHAIGYRDPETAQNYEKGWQGLFANLTAWLHDGEAAEPMVAGKE